MHSEMCLHFVAFCVVLIYDSYFGIIYLTHWGRVTHICVSWGRVTHICVSKLTIIGSDNDLSPGRRQAIIWTSAGILLIGPLGTNLSKILIEICWLPFKKIHLKMSTGKWRSSYLGPNVLRVSLRVASLAPGPYWTPRRNWSNLRRHVNGALTMELRLFCVIPSIGESTKISAQ